MSTYEEHITALEDSSEAPSDTIEAACDAISFVATLHNLFVTQGVINSDADVSIPILENLTDAYFGELAAATMFLSQDQFSGIGIFLTTLEKTMDDPNNDVPVSVRKGFGRLAKRIEKARETMALMEIINPTTEKG